MTAVLAQPYEDLQFMAPLSQRHADQIVRFLAGDLHGTVLDLGCGWGELLLRIVAATQDAHGIGIDSDTEAIAHGRRLAQQRGLANRVTLVCGDARTRTPSHADAVVCIGASQIWGPPVQDNQPLDYGAALMALRAMVSPGARVLYGEAVWSSPPTPQAAEPLAGRLDEFVAVADLLDLVADHGFMPIAFHEASLGEWDEFESGFSARYSRWLAEHRPDHPDAADVRARAARQRAAYFRGYRGILGMAYLHLLAA